MLIPQFSLDQDNEFIILQIRLPYVKISKSEFYIQDDEFRFHLNPYVLNIRFENKLKDNNDEPESAVYDHNNYILKLKLFKQNTNEHFTGLKMISNLLNQTEHKQQKKKEKINKNKKVLIEVIEDQNESKTDIIQDQSDGNQNESNNHVNQFSYGFNYRFTDLFEDLQEENMELCELSPENIVISKRIEIRNQILINNFDIDSYIYDQYENEEIQEIIKNPDIDYQFNKTRNGVDNQSDVFEHYSEQENDCLIRLRNQECIVDTMKEKNEIDLMIVDILFSILYEKTCMQGELSSESAKTINRMSSCLSCLIVDDNLIDLIKQSFTRCISHALFRSIDICRLVLEVLTDLIDNKYLILKYFIQLKLMNERSEPRYLLNKLFIDDMIVYIQQKLDQSQLTNIKQQLTSIVQQNIINQQSLPLIDLQTVEQIYFQEMEEGVEQIQIQS